MAWTHVIGDTKPRTDNPLNLETIVTWTNSETGEALTTKPFGNDINKAIKNHCRSLMKVLADRDVAMAEMALLKGRPLDLALSPEEQVKADQQDKLADLQQQGFLVSIKIKNESDQKYMDALTAAKVAFAE